MKVSIVIPTHERPHLLRRLLDSIAFQTYQNYEVIVVDDGSSQKEQYQNLIDEYRHKFSEFRYVRNETSQGAPSARNRGIHLAREEVIALVDDDDEWLPYKLEKQVEVMSQNIPKLGLIYTWTKVVCDGHVIQEYTPVFEGSPLSALLLECFIPSPSVMLTKQAALDAGLFDPMMPSCQDWDLWLRILKKGYECRVVKSFETIYHKHNGITIGNSSQAKQGYEMFYHKHLRLYRKYHPRLYLTLKFRQMLKPIKSIIKAISGKNS
ncbi:MAG: glycosyltransferase [Chlamydiales bacterium]